jgi:type II secretory pathway component PulF
MLWGLAVAAERGIPLPSAIEAFASEHWGLARWSARSLARLVAAGTPLPDALAFVGGMVPREALVPIRVGHDLGALSAGLRQATVPAGPQQTVWDHQQTVWDQLAIRVAYLCFVILFASGMIVFMMLKIAPAFQKIFADFNAELPGISRFMIGIIPALSMPLTLFLLAVVFLLFFYLPLRYFRVITWDLPFMGRVTRKLHAATVLESLALTAERNQPFPRTIATLARGYPKWSIRWRLQGTLVDVTTGTDWAASLHARGLISRADRAVLQAAQRVGNLAWALREIADSMRRRAAYRLQAWVHLLFPAAILSLAAFVMAFWTAFFLPLMALIQRLS